MNGKVMLFDKPAVRPKKSSVAILTIQLGIVLLLTFRPVPSYGADPTQPVTLENYLKALGYEGVDFNNTDYRQPRLDAQLSNGCHPRLLVDTGWDISALSATHADGLKTADELGIELKDSVLGTITNHDIVLIEKLVLGGRAQFSNQPARVRELKADYINLPFDGVLGLDFLLRNFCLVDCWKHRLYVRASKLSPEQAEAMEKSLRLAGLSEVRLNPRGPLNLNAEINGHPSCLLVDTGAPFNILDSSQVKELGLGVVRYSRPATGSYIEREATTSIIGMGDIGLHHAKVTRLDSLRLGERRWKNVYFAITDLAHWGVAAPGTPGEFIKGLLSHEFLARHGALIDVAGRKLWLRASKGPAESH